MIGVQSALRELREIGPRNGAASRRSVVCASARRRLALSGVHVAGTVLWVSAAIARAPAPGVAGFLPHISYLWYGGVVLLMVAIALAGKESEPHVAIASCC